MPTPVWQPGTVYPPGSLVRPRVQASTTQTQPTNQSFEDGMTGWEESFEGGTGTWSDTTAKFFDGVRSAQFVANAGGTGPRSSVLGILKNAFLAEVRPGQTINFSVQTQRDTAPDDDSWENAGARIYWYDQYMNFISYSIATTQGRSFTPAGMVGGSGGNFWVKNTGSAVAPALAAFAQAAVVATDNTIGEVWVDYFEWDYVFQGVPAGLVFRAVQSVAGYSGSTEPDWPTVNGQQVVDNEVTWEAVYATRVVWEATPILVSGSYEPDFPEDVTGSVIDGTVVWVTMDQRVKDEKCPNSTVVAIAASKVFAADGDIIGFSATVNPLDWSTLQDAGYLPFGLQTHGASPCSALGLYRGNLVAFNDEGYQMWQVDEDPANMALLDASPVDCPYPKSVQPVANDLVFLTAQGIRNIGIAGASTNIQAGFFGKQIDPLVKEAINSCQTPIGLFWPGAGQYWLFFGEQAFVLTMNGGPKDMSWSRYVFPEAVTDWTLLDGQLYLRAGNLVWRVDENALQDDMDEVFFRVLETDAECEYRITESGVYRILE